MKRKRTPLPSQKWSEWREFPDPRAGGILIAPFGPGCYELRNGKELVLFGIGRHVARPMTSLLPPPLGCGTRNNSDKRDYVQSHLAKIEYRTLACSKREEAAEVEGELKRNGVYRFQT
jgi:hypothetical protein